LIPRTDVDDPLVSDMIATLTNDDDDSDDDNDGTDSFSYLKHAVAMDESQNVQTGIATVQPNIRSISFVMFILP
jgi:hypothetical protein